MMSPSTASTSIHFAPLLSHGALIALGLAALVLLAISALIFRRGLAGRLPCLVIFGLIFLNPSLVEEQRSPVPDVAVILADRSPSQSFGDRMERLDTALTELRTRLGDSKEIEIRVADAPAGGSKLARDTRLMEALENAFADVPMARRAGAILVTDGQVHDAPADASALAGRYGPVHMLLTGRKDERDRQLVVSEAPAYGIVGKTARLRFRVEDVNIDAKTADIVIHANGATRRATIPVGEEQEITVEIDHAGQNVFEIEAAAVDGELTLANNKAPIIVNGVRDRMRVLLVSGQPHAGGRTWRDMLASDPGVDLVHFTILREPQKLDMTPQSEMALIAFPFRELFEVKLYDFDLIIFDRYTLNPALPTYYFANIARYVREGGALLEASGPSFAGDNSIYRTEIGSILPARPDGPAIEGPVMPTLTETGNRHPVTQGLTRDTASGQATWGHWLRQMPVAVRGGDVLMTGSDNRPLLILDHVGKGRVAQLASDQIWLWARGYDGGGPHAEFLRRLAHWLMKEPELEETALDVAIENDRLTIRRHTLDDQPTQVMVSAPDGAQTPVTLNRLSDGVLGGSMAVDQLGIYTVDDGLQQRFAIAGDLNPPELRAVVTTEDRLKPLVDQSGGGLVWLSASPLPDIRTIDGTGKYAGRNWLGLRHSSSYNVTGLREKPLLPLPAWAVLLLGAILLCWRLEGRARR